MLNKQRVEDHLRTRDGKKKLYNFLARFLLEKVKFPQNIPRVSLVVDRCKNQEEVKDFNGYLVNQLEAMLPLNTRLDIDHQSSQDNAGLQVVDLFCWGVARKHAEQDRAWYRRPYNMRHSYATAMPMAGMTPAFCAKQLGHSVEMFLRTYAKWLDGAQNDLEMARLEASMNSPPILPRSMA